ncbi:hypothetical protein GUJ93_ZPchr0002g23364 [Zizania palustris]|uniref:Uncharacterized protein n=1 Tax=Zizania palustris TaxID=103762 RepID=A0A8J5S732_ZIZPA|nr:hypothetical protein GUJ93_ZPchr0002g23364 [Zizania palustris]
MNSDSFTPASYHNIRVFDTGMTIFVSTVALRSTPVPGGNNNAKFKEPLGGALFLPLLGPSRGFGGSGSTISPPVMAVVESVRWTVDGDEARGGGR